MKQRIFFITVFWSLFFGATGFYFYKTGSDYKARCELVPGEVVSLANMPEFYMKDGVAEAQERLFPVVQYKAGDRLMTYTEKTRRLEPGTKVTVMYEKTDPSIARLYNAGYWFRLSFFIPAFAIASFVFCITLITMTNYGKQPELLPGELDPFVYGERGPQLKEKRTVHH